MKQLLTVLFLSAGIFLPAEEAAQFSKPAPVNGIQTLTPTPGNTFLSRIVLGREAAPGNYLLEAEYRADNPSDNAGVTVSAETLPPSTPRPASPQTVALNRSWTRLSLPVSIAEKSRPVLVFRKRAAAGTCGNVQIRNPKMRPLLLTQNKNLFADDGCFTGQPGDIPAGWSLPYGYCAGNILTREFGFENSSVVFQLRAEQKNVTLQGLKYPLPKLGGFEFSVWARSLDKPSNLSLFLLGDGYQWEHRKSFRVTPSWQKFTVAGTVPGKVAKEAFFWPRIDLGQNGSVLIGKVELMYRKSFSKKAAANEISNPSFLFGPYGWQLYAPESGTDTQQKMERQLSRRDPVWKNDTLTLDPGACLRSRQFPLVPGQEYTVLVRMKNAHPGKQAKCKAFLLDGKWQYVSRQFVLSDEYKTYRFCGKAKRSPLNRGYLRLDASEHSVTIDKVRVVQGKNAEGFPEPALRMGFLGKNIISDTDRTAEIDLRFLMSETLNHPVPVKMEIRDAWGTLVRSENFTLPPRRDQRRKLLLNPDGRRGTFHVTLSGEGETAEFSYAVLKDLSALPLADIPLAGHLAPLSPQYDTEILNRYLAFSRMAYTRFFVKEVLDFRKEPRLLEAFRKHHKFNVICLPIPMNSKYATAETVTPELEKEFADDIRRIVTAFKDAVQGVELFNEPELWRNKSGPKKNFPNMPPEKVVKYYRIARRVIRETATSIKLMGPVVWKDYGYKFIEKGGGSAIDIYTWHGYNDTPELFGTYDRIMEYRKFIREKTGKEFLMWNTEQYYGYRNSGIPESDAESGARYFRDSELEYAAVCANNLIHHAAGGAKWSSFGLKYFYSGLRGSDEQLVFDALSSMNAAIEFLSNAGRGEEVNLGDALKCFFFPQAQGAPLAVLYATNPESKGEMRIPDGVGVYDMNGNRVADNKVEVGYSPLYLKFKKGNARSILAGLEFRNLGKPFSARLRLSGKDTLLLNIGNRTNRPEKIQVSFSGLPSGWRLENPVREIIPGPGEKKELEFKILQSDFEPMKPYVFKIGIRSPRGYDTETVRLAALFARYAEDTPETGWITLDEKNLAIDHNPSDKWKGPEDLGAKFVCYWNENGFGLTVAVTDDKFVFPDNAPKAWDADSLQLYFDMKRDATPFSGSQNKNRGDDCDYNISLLAGKIPAVFLEMGCDARFIGEANLSRGLDPAVRLECLRLSKNQLRYKMFFPKETLPYIKFREGTVFGFSMLVNDNDGKGRKQGLTLTPKGTEPFRKPHLYMDMILEK